MFLHTDYIEPRSGYRLFVRFNNGVSGEITLENELWGEVFEPLRDEALFLTARQDPLMGTVVWENGADFAPEFLLDLLSAQTNKAALKPMKLLVTGKAGQVGFELQRSLAPLGEIIAVDLAECDLANPEAIRQLVRDVRPDVIVNPAAYTAVDKAESDQERAAAVNAVAPGIFGEEAARLGAFVIHYSTDYVFDGTKQGAYVEDDATNPQSVYGLTKRDGELALQAANPRHLILRTSWVVGAHGGNFAKTMLKLAADRDSLSVVADQWGVPTSAALLADIAAQLVRQWQREGEGRFPTAPTIALPAARPTGATTPATSSVQPSRPASRSRCSRKPSSPSPRPTTPRPPNARPTPGSIPASSVTPSASNCRTGRRASTIFFSRYFESHGNS